MKKNFFHWAILAALLFAAQEALFRAVFPLPEIENFNRVNYSDFPRDRQTASFAGARQWAMNATFRWNSRPDGVSFDTPLNLYGFHDDNWKVQAKRGTERVMLIGDSLVEGFMANDRETIPRGYSLAAARRGKTVEAMNFGIGGSGIATYLRLFGHAVPLFRPGRIVLVFYANDLPYSLPGSAPSPGALVPAFTPSLEPRVIAIGKRLWRNQAIPRRWHSPPKLFVPVVPDPLNPWSNPPPEFSQIDPVIAENMRRGDFNPYVVNILNHAEMALRQPIEPRPALRWFQDIARNAHAELHLIYLPLPVQVSDYYVPYQRKYAFDSKVTSLLGPEYQAHARALGEACHELGIPFLDLTPLFRNAEAGGEHLYWNYDEHLRGSSYLRVGATIEAWVASPETIKDRLVSLN